MSEQNAREKMEKLKRQKPIIIKKINSNQTFLRLNNLTIPTQLYKEQKIYESQPGDFLKGDPDTKIVLTNHLNMLTNSSRTVAHYINLSDNKVIKEKTSDNVTKLIGQKSYDTILAALCSVISQELKVRGMLALLTQKEENPGKEEKFTKREDFTDKTKIKQRRRRNKLIPYVVKDDQFEPKLNRIVIDPKDFKFDDSDSEKAVETDTVKVEITENGPPELMQIEKVFDENSNNSDGNLSLLSGHTNVSNIFSEVKANELLHRIDQHTQENDYVIENRIQTESYQDESQSLMLQMNEYYVLMPDGSRIMVPVKPEDDFHIATPEILKNVTNEERKKLLWFQAYKDWKLCLERDEDGLLPLHNAVLNNDLDLVRRQSLVLRNRLQSLDIVAANRTALQMAIKHNNVECTAMLLQYGADPLFTDEESRTAIHLAAEMSSQLLTAVITHCQNNAVQLLQDHDLWTPFMEKKSKAELTSFIMDHICQKIDSQGYTALMLASKIGNHSNVKQLIEASPSTVNMSMPNCGDTALYQTVAATCLDVVASGNLSKIPENFGKTIEILLENGADPAIDNSSGSNVNILLTEFNIAELSMLVANKLIFMKYSNGNAPAGLSNFDKFMLVKDDTDQIKIKILEIRKKIKPIEIEKETEEKSDDNKPKILENVTVTKRCLPNLKNFRKINPKEKLTSVNKKFNSKVQGIKINNKDTVSNTESNVSSEIGKKIPPPFIMTHTKMPDLKNKEANRPVENSCYLGKYTNVFMQNKYYKKTSTIITPNFVNSSSLKLGKADKSVDVIEVTRGDDAQKRKPDPGSGPTSKKQRLLESLEKTDFI